jgi:hypothetical protein
MVRRYHIAVGNRYGMVGMGRSAYGQLTKDGTMVGVEVEVVKVEETGGGGNSGSAGSAGSGSVSASGGGEFLCSGRNRPRTSRTWL